MEKCQGCAYLCIVVSFSQRYCSFWSRPCLVLSMPARMAVTTNVHLSEAAYVPYPNNVHGKVTEKIHYFLKKKIFLGENYFKMQSKVKM